MNKVLQGTTPKLVMILPSDIEATDVTSVELTLVHKDTKTIVETAGVEIDAENNAIRYRFTEAYTLLLDPKYPLYWQLRIRTPDGIFGTEEAEIDVKKLLSGRAMT